MFTNKMLKASIRDELTDRFRSIDGGVFINVQALNSERTYLFRKALNDRKVKFQVVRNRLARDAFVGHGYVAAELDNVLKGPVGVLYTEEENSATTAAKFLAEWKREVKDKLVEWKGAFLEGQVLGAKAAEQLKDAPSKNEARAMLLGTIQAPIVQLLRTIREPEARIIYVLNAMREKREEGGEKAAS